METTAMVKWGSWSVVREVMRGLFHFIIGLTAWVLVQPMQVSSHGLLMVIIGVGSTFICLDGCRVLIVRSNSDSRFVSTIKQLNHQVLLKYLVRDSEEKDLSTSTKSILGLMAAWFAPVWIAGLAVLLFGAVDPIAKFGKILPIKRFQNGKSLGGMFYGLLAGMVMAIFVTVMDRYFPIFPAFPPWHITTVFTVGVATAPFLELFGGRWDNFLIPAGTAGFMWCTNYILTI